MRRLAIIGAAVVVVALAAALVVDLTTSHASHNHASGPHHTSGLSGGSGVPLPPVEVKRFDENGTPVRISDLAAGKPMVVNVWSTSCVPCQQETPAIEKVHKKLGSRVTIVGVDVSDSFDDGNKFIKKYGATYTQVRDPQAHFLTAVTNSAALPSTFIVDAEGRIVDQEFGAVTVSSLEAMLRTDLGIKS